MSPKAAERRPSTLAEAIRIAREGEGMTQVRMGHLLDTSVTNIQNWESGRHEPSLYWFEKIAELFGWDLPYSVTARLLGPSRWAMSEEPDGLAAAVG
jgi:DNA-binding XRE family transcriptional regulator